MLKIKIDHVTGRPFAEYQTRGWRKQLRPLPDNPVKLNPDDNTITAPTRQIADAWIASGASPQQVKVA